MLVKIKFTIELFFFIPSTKICANSTFIFIPVIFRVVKHLVCFNCLETPFRIAVSLNVFSLSGLNFFSFLEKLALLTSFKSELFALEDSYIILLLLRI